MPIINDTNGLSAYEVAVQQGFVGTEAEWLASLVGPAGATGPTGPTGETGPQGAQGIQGNAGATGATGSQGPQGETGPQGATGATGAQGIQGDTGPQGMQGMQGATGDTGPQGPQGMPGNDGAQGPQGPQGMQGTPGNDGAQGPQGMQGIPGNDGAQGPQGIQGMPGNDGPQGPQGDPGPNTIGGYSISTGVMAANDVLSFTGFNWTNSNTLATQVASKMTDPMTSPGDMVIRDMMNQTTRLGVGSTGQVLSVNMGAPAWAAAPVDNTAYAASWATNTTQAPTQQAVYNAITPAIPLVKQLLVSTTSAGTALIVVPAMTFNYVALGIYKIEMLFNLSSAVATTGHGFAFDTSTAVTSIGITFYHQFAITGSGSIGSAIGDNGITQIGVTQGVPSTGTQFMHGAGLLIAGANTGTAQLMKRSEVAGNSTILAGSIMIITKIG